MNVKILLEIEVPDDFSKHRIDNEISENLREEGYGNVRTIGAYTDEDGVPVTEEFYLDESSIKKTAKDILENDGIAEDTAKRLVSCGEFVPMVCEKWFEYIMKDASANTAGRRYFESLVRQMASMQKEVDFG